MGMDTIKTKFKDLHCGDCGELFDIESTTGEVAICEACFKVRVDEIHAGGPIPVEHILPLAGGEVTCGKRTPALPHDWRPMGLDPRHFGDGRIEDALVFVCIECGRDKFHSTRPKPKRETPPALDPEVKALRDTLRRQLFEDGVTGRAREEILAAFDQGVK